MSKDYSQCCDELAEMIKNNQCPMAGWAIQEFCELVSFSETPAMALALVKKSQKELVADHE